MSKKTLSRFITILLVTVLAVLGLGKTMVQATSPAPTGPSTNVIITKVESDNEAQDITYEEMIGGIKDIAKYFGGGKVMPGVSFTYYSVLPEQLATMTGNPAAYTTAAQVETFTGATGTATIDTDVDGQVDLNLAEGNYWFIENTKGTIASSTAVPFELALPFTNATGNGYLPVVNVYPKNTIKDANPDVEKTVDESNVAIGDINTWTVKLDIPEAIEDYEQFSFYDDIDSRLTFEGTDKVVATAAGITLIKGTDYTVNYAPSRLNVVFTEAGRIKLANADPKKVAVSFETKVNDTAIMGQEIENSATLQFDNGVGTTGNKVPGDLPSVHTGGKAFVKIDKDTKVKLAGAEFKIKNAAGEFVNGTLTSNDEGEFEVKGLPYGEYTLVETKAPNGYALPTNPETTFAVNAKSYYKDPTTVEVDTKPSDVEAQRINNRKMTIPQTGGFGTIAFTIVGAVLMLTSLIIYKRTNKKPNQS